MNAERRKQIEAVKTRIEDLCQEIEDIESAEQEYFDNMPESLQNGERGNLAEEAICNLSSAKDALGEAVSDLDTAAQ